MNTSVKSDSLLFRILVISGGIALFGAVLVEITGIIGRLSGFPLPGSVELVQILVTVAGTVALVMATLCNSHAAVRLVTGRLKGKLATSAARINNLSGAVFFLLLLAGSVWIALDLWFAAEESEIWRIPYKPLRVLVVAGTLAVACIFLGRVRTGAEH